MSNDDDIRANEMAQAMYEAFPSPRRIDCGEEDFDPIPWHELRSSAHFAWLSRARNMMRDGWVLARKDAPLGAVSEIARIARAMFDHPISVSSDERLGLAWGEVSYEDDVAVDAALRVLVNFTDTASGSERASGSDGALAGVGLDAREPEERK